MLPNLAGLSLQPARVEAAVGAAEERAGNHALQLLQHAAALQASLPSLLLVSYRH